MEELHEFEVMWPEKKDGGPISAAPDVGRGPSQKKVRPPGSPPMEIPAARRQRPAESHNDEDERTAEMIPPHILASRNRPAAFSMHSGQGRTLKGRDLCNLRNAVLRMTGFFEGRGLSRE